ncbi:hypothetical protein CMV_012204 [Castanea mollissima]|uniref:Uncharacterized protein n=1 Tax=Castanea mollissima TaxID=60419 RepID=A0A8J4R0H9_9ROSI|nr:hypothetical protein CMV_012204 [Castanea mollissima]
MEGCLAGIMPPSFKGEEGGEEEEEIRSPHYAEHTLNVPWPDLVDVDLVEESMQMIGGLQSLARTQSSQYVLNEASWHIKWKLLSPLEEL